MREIVAENPQASKVELGNSVAILLLGSSRSRIVVLLDRKRLLDLAQREGFLDEISIESRSIVFGILRLTLVEDRFNGNILFGEGSAYARVLQRIASTIAARDEKKLVWRGHQVEVKNWDHFRGLRRRGQETKERLRRDLDYSHERVNKLLEVLWRMRSLTAEYSSPNSA